MYLFTSRSTSTVTRMASAGRDKLTLLTLPGEIRNGIYRYVVVHDGQISHMLVCSAVRKEVGSIYFSENTFFFAEPRDSFDPDAAISLLERRAGLSANIITRVVLPIKRDLYVSAVRTSNGIDTDADAATRRCTGASCMAQSHACS